MRKLLVSAGAALALLGGSVAQATIVIDPVGDFINPLNAPTAQPDLDVTSFEVLFNSTTNLFTLNTTFAGDVDAAKPGFYVIGVNTGTGTIAPFAGVGQPNVRFNQVMVVQKTGAGVVGPNAFTANVSGNRLSFDINAACSRARGGHPSTTGSTSGRGSPPAAWPRCPTSHLTTP